MQLRPRGGKPEGQAPAEPAHRSGPAPAVHARAASGAPPHASKCPPLPRSRALTQLSPASLSATLPPVQPPREDPASPAELPDAAETQTLPRDSRPQVPGGSSASAWRETRTGGGAGAAGPGSCALRPRGSPRPPRPRGSPAPSPARRPRMCHRRQYAFRGLFLKHLQ